MTGGSGKVKTVTSTSHDWKGLLEPSPEGGLASTIVAVLGTWPLGSDRVLKYLIELTTCGEEETKLYHLSINLFTLQIYTCNGI